MADRFSCLADAGVYFADILRRIKYRDERRQILKLEGNHWYFQFEWDDKCNFTGKPMISRSAKYYLSPHMTQTEVVNRIFLAAVKAEEHETRERFLYRPEGQGSYRAPYNTHIDVDMLYGIANKFDVRRDANTQTED